jgi:hypothetical protein
MRADVNHQRRRIAGAKARPRQREIDPVGWLERHPHFASVLRSRLADQTRVESSEIARTNLGWDLERDPVHTRCARFDRAHTERRSIGSHRRRWLRTPARIDREHPKAAPVRGRTDAEQSLKRRHLNRDRLLTLIAERVGRDADRVDGSWRHHDRNRCVALSIGLDRTECGIGDPHFDHHFRIGAELDARDTVQSDLRPGEVGVVVARERDDSDLRIFLFRRRVDDFVVTGPHSLRRSERSDVRVEAKLGAVGRAHAQDRVRIAAEHERVRPFDRERIILGRGAPRCR